MKKVLFTIMACLGTMGSYAYDTATEGQIYYGSNCEACGLADGTVAIYKYYTTDDQNEVTFPATIQVWDGETMTAEYEVSAVGVSEWKNVYLGSASTYQYTGTVNSLVFAEGIKTINASAFYEMTSLQNVALPSTLAAIGDYAFTSCDAMKHLTIGAQNLTLGTEALKGGSSWDAIAAGCTVVVPDGCTANYASYSADNTQPWSYWDQFYANNNIHEASSFTIDNGGYATYFNKYGYTMPSGVEGYIVSSTADGAASTVKVYDEGDVVCDNIALLLKSKNDIAESVTFNVEALSSGGNTATWPMYDSETYYTNLLNGVQTAQTIIPYEGDYYYYKLADGDNGLGWYWGATDGGVFDIAAHRCYLGVAQAASASKAFLPFADGVVTGINTLVNKVADANAVYNLQGMKVGAGYKGIVVINGKKYINN